jgi:hypothetical protein
MRSIENTAVNDLISRASGGRRLSASMAAVDDDADGNPDPDAAQLTLPVAMPVAAPFEGRRTTAPYPVVHRGPAVASPEWPPATAPELLEPASPRRLYEAASQVEIGGTRGFDRERMVPTFQLRRPSEVRGIVARLVFPVALLVSIGVVVGAYVAFSGGRGAVRDDLAATAPAAGAPAVAPSQAPATAPSQAPAAASASTATAAPAVISAPAAQPAPEAAAAVAPGAPDPAAAGAAPASPELVDVRIDSIPAGATVMLVDRGRAQLIGDTPVDTALDPSREYDLVFTSPSAPPHVEHLDPRTTRRVEVALGMHDAVAHPADAPRPVEHAAADHPADAPRRVEHAAADHPAAEHTPARPARPRAEPRAEPPVGQGTLMISSKPPCEIVIDGRTTGLTTPQRSISLPAGNHRITLLNSEKSIHKVVSVQIIANTTAKIIEDLMQ